MPNHITTHPKLPPLQTHSLKNACIYEHKTKIKNNNNNEKKKTKQPKNNKQNNPELMQSLKKTFENIFHFFV
jgi:hypothetical protein